jgi:hypothetical protein
MHKLAVFAIALVLNPSLSASGNLTAGDDAVPVRNWQAPAYWAVPIPDDGARSTRVEEPGTDTSTLATSTLAFVGITPCRVADTRQAPPGEFGQPWMQPSTVRSFTLTGQCAIPANAEAVSFNFTVTNTAGAGFLLVYPAGGQVPGVSTLNYLAAQTIANAAVVPLGTLGAGKGISVIPGVAGFDLIVDVNGYYVAQGVVSSLNGATGAVSITAGSNVVVTPSGQNVQLSAGPLVSSLKGLTGVVDVAESNGATVSVAGQSVVVGTNATVFNTPNTLVARGTFGDFATGTVQLLGSPYLLTASDGSRLLHTTGDSTNFFAGVNAGGTGATGIENTAVGSDALKSLQTGVSNTAFGHEALATSWWSNENSAFGTSALAKVTGGSNTAVGAYALMKASTGSTNTAIGVEVMTGLTTGNSNIAVGPGAGNSLTTGSGNIFIGLMVYPATASESNTIRIGASTAAATFIRGISGVNVGTASAVYVNASGQLGTATSSARFKDDVTDLADPTPLLQALRPVSFVYKTDETRTPQAGLIAEEVEKIAPHLVTRDEEGHLLSVRYDQLVPLLLAEAQRLERDNARLLAALEGLTERMAAVERNLVRPPALKP